MTNKNTRGASFISPNTVDTKLLKTDYIIEKRDFIIVEQNTGYTFSPGDFLGTHIFRIFTAGLSSNLTESMPSATSFINALNLQVGDTITFTVDVWNPSAYVYYLGEGTGGVFKTNTIGTTGYGTSMYRLVFTNVTDTPAYFIYRSTASTLTSSGRPSKP